MPEKSNFYKIRPSARLLSTIGEDIIKDVHAAIVELVKNAYDADASKVEIEFSTIKSEENNTFLKLIIRDFGHGMSFDVVVNRWMVPATDDKLHRRYSPKGRLMQGRKGIGRYAAAILGDIMLLETVDENKQKTSLEINWNEVTKKQFLDDIDIIINSEVSNEAPGTKFTMLGTKNKLDEWTTNEINSLIRELRKLISPVKKDSEIFDIILKFKEFPNPNYNNREITIEPYPLLELFDYRLSGTVSENGHASLIYENKTISGIEDKEIIEIDIPLNPEAQEYCGPIEIDLRVFDRDPESIQNLINKGVKDPTTGLYLGKLDTRRLLDEICGVAVYRGDFRIRPYGDSAFDWLRLDEFRVQDPSTKIGRNQVSGFVIIKPEEISHLEEKSARDGLKETKYYEGLRQIVWAVLKQIETRRYAFRKRIGKGRKKVKVEKEIDSLLDFTTMSDQIERTLLNYNVNAHGISQIKSVISQIQEEKAKEVETILNEFALYQGQATLGKIVMVIMHEGRKPLGWFNDQSEYMPELAKMLAKNNKKETLDKLIDRAQTYKTQSDILVRLFNKLEPLAVKRRGKRKKLDIKKVINTSAEVFESEMKRYNIDFILECKYKVIFLGWEEDFYTILTNLFENSIYWLKKSRKLTKEIHVKVNIDDQYLTIDFIDNGPGIDNQLMKDDILFDPGITTKPPGEGTGLGLAIAGEAVQRNSGTLKALVCDTGAYFRMEFTVGSSSEV